MKIPFYTFLILFLLPAFSKAQKLDSISRKKIRTIIERFPSTRTLGVQYERFERSDFENVSFGEQTDGKLNYMERFKASANLPVFNINKKLLFSVSGLYTQTKGEFERSDDQNMTLSHQFDLKYWSASAGTTYITSFKKKMLIFTGSLITDGNENDIQRVRGLVTGTLLLKRSANEKFSVGVIGLVDQSSRIPAIPMLGYERLLGDSPWTLDVFFPKKLMLERKVSRHGLLFVGTEIFNDRNFFQLNTGNFDGVYEYNKTTLQSGITYEHRFFGRLYVMLRTGVSDIINARIVEVGERASNYVSENKQNTTFYTNVGISYSLF
ncbi:hypothetical protein [Sphingobacterium sp. LRF_L2]|uniref:hypothetical protein n=1 Tax=Sphingobacterium sp. LRF_L2 TaxID=3369421 RepID=UPI003F5F2DB5